MTLSTIQKNDREQLRVIVRRCFTESIDLPGVEKETLIGHIFSDIDKFAGSSSDLFVKSHEGDEIYGFILIKEWWNLAHLFVLPSFHARGIGKLLLSTSAEVCSDKTDKGYLYVNSSMNAEGFYRKFGFVDRKVESKKSEFVVPLKYIF